MKQAILWGGSGHAKVLRPILERNNYSIVGIIDRNPDITPFIEGCGIFNSPEHLLEHMAFGREEDVGFSIAIGGDKGKDRISIQEKLTGLGFYPITLIHQSSWVADTANLSKGVQVLGMAAVSEEVQIGEQSIINTNASVDHECRIGKGCHIMPGATLAGCVEVGDFATIGSNATVLPRVKIGIGSFIGAGAVVVRDVDDYTVVVGNPAHILIRS